jgi:hypothetical protein
MAAALKTVSAAFQILAAQQEICSARLRILSQLTSPFIFAIEQD